MNEGDARPDALPEALPEALIERLSSGLVPVRRLRAPWWRALLWLAVCGGVAVVFAVTGGAEALREKLAKGPDEMVELVSAAATASLAAVAAFMLAVPGRSARWALLPLPAVAAWAAASGWGCMRATEAGSDPSALHPPMVCFRFIVLMSVPLSALLYVMLRRAYTVRPNLTAMLAGLAAAAAAAVLLDFDHPFDLTATDMAAHAAAVAFVIGANRLVSGPALRRWVLPLALLLPAHSSRAQEARPVVVELFTSQGCSSCPPADALLSELTRRPGVLPLAFHVEYWNTLGWTDPFSAPAFTARQRQQAARVGEATIYTPEMVIDGARAVVGSDREAVEAGLAAARSQVLTRAFVSVRRSGGGEITVNVGAGEGRATILVAGFDGSHVTPVGRGENGGRTLQESNIVRSLTAVGRWNGGATQLRLPAPAGEQVAVLLEAEDGRLFGAAVLPH